MQELQEINKTPLVEILSKQLNTRVAKSGDNYITLANKEVVSVADIETAMTTQETDYFIAQLKQGEDISNSHIQEPIGRYNIENGTNFKSVDSCNKYVTFDTYPHKQFCIDIVAFNVDVWTKAREIQTKVLSQEMAMPTVDEFIDLLPVFG